MADKTTSYRPTKQERSALSETRILDAAEKLFSEKGFEKTRIADVIAEARCSNGSFYFRFGSKREVFDVMLDRYLSKRASELKTVDLSRGVHGNVKNVLSHYASHSFEAMRTNHGMYRAAQEISVVDQDVWNKLTALTLITGERFEEVADQYADEISAPDHKKALQHAVQFVIMTSLQTALGAGPLFPKGLPELRALTIRAALGVLKQ
jgi:AcrR family transcriptional regulator